MIKLKKVSISNFLSFGKGPTEIQLDNSKHILIKGNNLDVGEEGESLNGSGKTAIQQSVIFALYGKGVDKLKPDQYVNLTNKKKLVVEIEIEDGKDTYVVRRGRKPSFVELTKNGVSITRDAMKNTDEDIQSIIGVPYEVFMSIYFLSPHKDSFMGMTSVEQRNYLESILSLDVLVKRSETLKAIKKDLAMEVKLLERDYDNAVSHKEKAEASVERLEASVRDFEEKRSKSIHELQESLDEASGIDFDYYIDQLSSLPSLSDIQSTEKDIKTLEREREFILSKIADYNKKSDTLDNLTHKMSSYYDQVREEKGKIVKQLEAIPYKENLQADIDTKKKRNDLRHEYSNVKSKKDSAKKDMDRLASVMEVKLDELDALQSGQCPYCSQSHVDNSKIKEVQEVLANQEKEFNDLEAIVNALVLKMSTMEEDGYELNALINEDIDEHDLLNKRNMLEYELDKVEDKLNHSNPYEDQIASIKEELAKIDVEKEKNQVVLIGEEIESKVKDVNELEDRVELTLKKVKEEIGTTSEEELKEMKREVSNLQSKIDDTRDKKNIYEDELAHAKSNIPDIAPIKNDLDEKQKDEEHVSYLVKLLTDPKSFVRKNIVDQYIPFVNKKINEYSERLGLMHVSEISPDMTVDIQYMQKEVSYYNMSQGERLRLNLATAMAFSDLMGLLGKSLNLYMVDEYLDSALDVGGMTKAFKFLTGKADNIMMISHREELSKEVDMTMIVTKKNGFSSIKLE